MPYNEDKIKFQTYSWVIWSTSFRVSELKYKIERQLIRLKELNSKFPNEQWKDLQIKYFDLLVEEWLSNWWLEWIKKREKDARQKTSPLRDLWLIDIDRKITEAWNELFNILEEKNYNYDNVFWIRNDSFFYLKQFLKVEFSENVDSNSYKNFKVKPLLSLIYLILNMWWHINKDIFTYILPIIENNDDLIRVTTVLKEWNFNIYDLLLDKIKIKDNHHHALQYFLENEKNENTFKEVFLNMKWWSFDLPYKKLYSLFKDYDTSFINDKKISLLKELNNYISLLPVKNKKVYYNYLFNTNKKLVNWDFNEELITFFENQSFIFNYSNSVDTNFFYLVHLWKWITNLEEYYDNNKRFLDLTDIFIFEKDRIILDEVALNIFEEIIDDLLNNTFSSSKEEYSINLYGSIDIQQINIIDEVKLLAKLKSIFPELSTEWNLKHAIERIKNERKIDRFNKLIDENFSRENITELLGYIKNRKDSKVHKYNDIWWEADLSTIFEYIVWISWYLISWREWDLSKYLNLDLDSNLLPRRFAWWWQADIIFNYHDHDLIIEVTLSNKDNQKKMELEPVPRHLWRYLLENSWNHYAIFVAPYLDPNVLVNFRAYKWLRYYNTNDTSKYVDSLKIIPLDIDDLNVIISSWKTYEFIKNNFDSMYENTDRFDWLEWRDNILKPNILSLNEN